MDEQVGAAIIGALIAFFLVLVRGWIANVIKRKRKHYDALVRLEAQLQYQGGVIYDNAYVIPTFMSALQKGHVYWSTLDHIEYDRQIVHDLHNLTLINSINAYYYELRRLNDDTRNLLSGYKTLESAYIAKNINANDYKNNAVEIASNLGMLKSYIEEEVLKKLIRNIAIIRIHIRQDADIFLRIKQKLVYSNDATEEQIANEIKEVEEELRKNGDKGKELKDKLRDQVSKKGT